MNLNLLYHFITLICNFYKQLQLAINDSTPRNLITLWSYDKIIIKHFNFLIQNETRIILFHKFS